MKYIFIFDSSAPTPPDFQYKKWYLRESAILA